MKASEGEPLPGLSATEWNRHVEASDAYHRTKALGVAGGSGSDARRPMNLIKVKNLTGGDLVRGAVVQLGDFLLDAKRPGICLCEAAVPTLDFGKHFAVVTNPIKANKIDEAQVAGWVRTRVNVGATTDRYAVIQSGQTYLKSLAIGPFCILNNLTGTGLQDCFVALEGGVITCLAKANADIDSGASGTVRVQHGTPGSETDAGPTIASCFNHGPDILEDDLVSVTLINWLPYCALATCS